MIIEHRIIGKSESSYGIRAVIDLDVVSVIEAIIVQFIAVIAAEAFVVVVKQ